jgi:streptogramin lyase/4-amino-4-deoxy-L-arabinose transferase-like glycosyltransferase
VGLLLAGAAVLALRTAQLVYASELNTDNRLAWSLHGLSVAALLAAGFLAARSLEGTRLGRPGQILPALLRFLSEHATVLLFFTGIMGIALFFRLWRFGDLPFGIWYDEAEHGLQALRILTAPEHRPIFEGAITGPAHYLYLVSLAFHWFGVSVQSVRLPSVLFGLLAVPAGYLVGRELLGKPAGLLLALLLAVSSWAVTFSRFGMYAPMSTPLFALLVVGLLLTAQRTGAWLHFLLTGLAVGYGLCFYTSFRLFGGVLALFFLHTLFVQIAGRRVDRHFWLAGVPLIVLGVLVAVAPLAAFALRNPDLFWARVANTFIFGEGGLADPWAALWENVRRHLFMFNWQGDPNGRHNLPSAPMLDLVSGALLVLGGAALLVRIHRPRALLGLAWLGFGLLPGILSLSFEAPQSLRANGALPAAYLLAVVPVSIFALLWRRSGGSRFPKAGGTALVICALAVGWLNFDRYFYQQANDFAVWNSYSTPETLAAQALNSMPSGTQAYVTEFFAGHPTLRFAVKEEVQQQGYIPLESGVTLPLAFAPDRNALLITNAESDAIMEQARLIYPAAYFTDMTPPMEGPAVVRTALLSPADIASVQGAILRLYPGNWLATATAEAVAPPEQADPLFLSKEAAIAADWRRALPLDLPFTAEWRAVLDAPVYGLYQFELDSPAPAQLTIGGQVVLSGTGSLNGSGLLAEGHHALRLVAEGAAGELALRWRSPAGEPSSAGGALFVPPVSANGLLGRYFPNESWQPPEAKARIDTRFDRYIHVVPLPRPYTVEWSGWLAAPVTGIYRFGLESIDESELWLDGQQVVMATQPNIYTEQSFPLEAGMHEIRILFSDRTDHTHINVFWLPPGGERTIIPTAALFPPGDSYTALDVPTAADLGIGDGAFLPDEAPFFGEFADLTGAGALLPGVVREQMTGLVQPSGVAVSSDGTVMFAEPAARRVRWLAPDGVSLEVERNDGQPWVEPFDIGAGPEGFVVLDAGDGTLHRFDAAGTPLATLGPLENVGRSRGVFVEADGSIWVAATSAGTLQRFETDGAKGGTLLPWSAGGAQPVDLAMTPGGGVFAADVGLYQLVFLSPEGVMLRSLPIPVANSIESPHLAVDGNGLLYLTDPEGGKVRQLAGDGTLLGEWNLAAALGRAVKPVGIAVGEDGIIWVTDTLGGTLLTVDPAGGDEP